MTQLKEKQAEKDAGAWSNLPPEQRQQQEADYHQLGMLARFHNVMGNETIHTLEYITRDIFHIFLNHIMVDRIAAMLNYFLVHLVCVAISRSILQTFSVNMSTFWIIFFVTIFFTKS